MGWASIHIQRLKEGQIIDIRPKGNSMSGNIESGQLVTLVPYTNQQLLVGDIVLCKVKGQEYLHLIKAIRDNRYLIGNNRGGINGWISASSIYGICIKIS